MTFNLTSNAFGIMIPAEADVKARAPPTPPSASRVETMKSTGRVVALLLTVAGIMTLSGQQERAGAGRGGAVSVVSASVRLENWGRIHLAAFGILGWRIGIRSNDFDHLTFSEAAARVDALNVAYIEGFGSQEFSREIPKSLDYNLAPGELIAVKD